MINKEIPNQCIIIGGGSSLSAELPFLWEQIYTSWTIGLNYSFKYFDSTMTMFTDTTKFYTDNYNDIKNLNMIIGQYHQDIDKLAKSANNTYLFPCKNKYYRDPRNGVYDGCLVGVFALTMAIWLLNVGTLFLLGFDFGTQPNNTENNYRGCSIEDITGQTTKWENNEIREGNKKYRYITHWYQKDCVHKGTGKVSFYNSNNKARKLFTPFMAEQSVKVFNVGLDSKIPNDIFPKISYKEFYERLDTTKYCQDCIRNYAKTKIINELKHIK